MDIGDTHIFLDSRDSDVAQHNGAVTRGELRWRPGLARLNTIRGYVLDLVSVQFHNHVYPINEFNNKFTLEGPSGIADIEISAGAYDIDGLASAIQTAINAQIATTGLTALTSFDDNTQQIRIQLDLDGAFTITAGDNGLFFEIVGMSDFIGVEANEFTSTEPVNLAGTRYVDVLSNISTNNWTSRGSQNVLVRIPIDTPFGTGIFYQPDSHPIYVARDTLDEILITLKDEWGNTFHLPEHSNIGFHFKLRAKGISESSNLIVDELDASHLAQMPQ